MQEAGYNLGKPPPHCSAILLTIKNIWEEGGVPSENISTAYTLTVLTYLLLVNFKMYLA